MGTKLHLLVPREIVRSVLHGTAATAACGFTKIYTREGVDAARDAGHKACKGCLVAVGESVTNGDEVTMHPADGWLSLLERVWKLDEAERSRPRVFTFTNTAKTWNFPPAA